MKSRLDDDLDSDRPLVVFLGDDVDEQDHDVLFPLLRARGTAVVRVHPHDLVTRLDEAGPTFTVDGRPLRPDLVVGWVLDELLLPGMAQLDVLARAGIPVVNDALTLFRAQHKFLDSSQLSAAGVLRYPVITGRDRAALLDWMAASDRPAVFKPLSGFGGRGLQKLADVPAAHALLDSLDGEPYYVVPYIDNPGRDIRVYTVNHHPVFAIYRYAADGAWVTNILAGGSMAVCPLSDEIVDGAGLARLARSSAGWTSGRTPPPVSWWSTRSTPAPPVSRRCWRRSRISSPPPSPTARPARRGARSVTTPSSSRRSTRASRSAPPRRAARRAGVPIPPARPGRSSRR